MNFSSPVNVKGVILAAGFGSRLKPMTDEIPKPLIPFAGVELLKLALYRMKKANISEVAINAHYKWQKIASFLEEIKILDLPKVYLSIEPNIMGTGGVYALLQEWRRSSALLAINGDIISTSSLISLLDEFQSKAPLALLSVRQDAHPRGKSIWVKDQKITNIDTKASILHPTATAHGFTGAQMLSPKLLEMIPPHKPSEIIPLYQNLIQKDSDLRIIIQPDFWFDLGIPADYWKAHMALLEMGKNIAKELGLYYFWSIKKDKTFYETDTILAPSITVNAPCILDSNSLYGQGTLLGPYVVCNSQVHVGKGAKISRSILMPGSYIADRQIITNSIIGKDFQIRIE